jgi:hypothetical protein
MSCTFIYVYLLSDPSEDGITTVEVTACVVLNTPDPYLAPTRFQ